MAWLRRAKEDKENFNDVDNLTSYTGQQSTCAGQGAGAEVEVVENEEETLNYIYFLKF